MKQDGERIAALEVQIEEVGKSLSEVKDTTKGIDEKVDKMTSILQTHNLKELETHNIFNNQINTLTSKVNDLERSSMLWKWLSPTLSAITAAVLTFLVIEYLKHL